MAKHRQCPHCKGKKGFQLNYQIKGNGMETRDFQGNVIYAERDEFADNDSTVTCLECGGHIDTEKVETET